MKKCFSVIICVACILTLFACGKKTNPIVDRMKLGKFTITPDNKVLLLPDYDIVGKDPDDVLKDKWF